MSQSKKFKYQNISEVEQSLIGVGRVSAGKTVETDEPVYNPNFKIVGSQRLVNVEKPTIQSPADGTTGAIIKSNKK